MRRSHLQLAFVLSTAALLAPGAQAADSTLDYDYFKTRVEPIFIKKRPEHARCVVCHTDNNSGFRLQKPENDKGWTEDASRKNFTQVSALVTPGSPDKSHLLMYPLAPEAGGSIYHSGGRQFASKDDPDWKTLAAWVNGAKGGASAKAK